MIILNNKFAFILLLFSNIILVTSAYASFNESSAGGVVGLFQPNYGKFSTIASNANQPNFPSSMLLIGGDATFMRKGFFTGGRALYGSTTSS